MTDKDEDLFPAASFDEDLPEPEAAEQPEEIEAEAPEQPAQEAPVEAEPEKTVPLAALQASRDEAKTLKSKLADFEQRFEQLTQQLQQPQRQVSDQEMIINHIRAAATADALATISEVNARGKFGDELVDEAFAAAQQSGAIQQFVAKRDGWGDLVKWYQGQKMQQEIGGDPDAYRARIEAEIRQKILAEQAAESVKQPSRGPSLASQPNLGSRQAPEWSGPTPLDDILKG